MSNQRRGSRLSDSEQRVLILGIASSNPRHIKKHLQDLCDCLQKGLRLPDVRLVAGAVVGHFSHTDTKVRRWAYKSIALLKPGGPAVLTALIDRLGVEQDAENILFLHIAIWEIADADRIDALIEQKLFRIDGVIPFVTHLFGTEKRCSNIKLPRPIVPDRASELDLKFLSLLDAECHLQDDWLRGKTKAIDLIPDLTTHTFPEVSEYAVFALHKNSGYGPNSLKFPLSDVGKKSANVRRWVYRLVTRDEDNLARRLDWLSERLRAEMLDSGSILAREGLALGLRNVWTPRLDSIVVDWVDREGHQDVVEPLLEHMARFSDQSSDYGELVLDRYEKELPQSLLRQKLESAASQTPLYRDLKEVDSKQSLPNTIGMSDQLPGLVPESSKLVVIHNFSGTINMGDKKQSINVSGGNIGNLVGGHAVGNEMQGTANSGTYSLNSDQRETLDQLLQFLERMPPQFKADTQAVVEAVKTSTDQASTSSIQKILGGLEKLKNAAEVPTEIALALYKFYDKIKVFLPV